MSHVHAVIADAVAFVTVGWFFGSLVIRLMFRHPIDWSKDR